MLYIWWLYIWYGRYGRYGRYIIYGGIWWYAIMIWSIPTYYYIYGIWYAISIPTYNIIYDMVYMIYAIYHYIYGTTIIMIWFMIMIRSMLSISIIPIYYYYIYYSIHTIIIYTIYIIIYIIYMYICIGGGRKLALKSTPPLAFCLWLISSWQLSLILSPFKSF